MNNAHPAYLSKVLSVADWLLWKSKWSFKRWFLSFQNEIPLPNFKSSEHSIFPLKVHVSCTVEVHNYHTLSAIAILNVDVPVFPCI